MARLFLELHFQHTHTHTHAIIAYGVFLFVGVWMELGTEVYRQLTQTGRKRVVWKMMALHYWRPPLSSSVWFSLSSSTDMTMYQLLCLLFAYLSFLGLSYLHSVVRVSAEYIAQGLSCMDRIVRFPAPGPQCTITTVWRGLHGDCDGALHSASGVWHPLQSAA